ncbi:hypothetical protein LK472_06605 [Leuconostoc lactis]|uniref:hypothetical protein n=1 Tax=Leuconostoc lactis TaxID=1246 RepID=UPI001D12F0DC|nr:hypothetical protein [Leuconostoc lactis]MCC2745078.1 hypothetical protein [Leuconostoc lactis]MCC2755615.1 hypothetical protein [Leuconostoc lactis]
MNKEEALNFLSNERTNALNIALVRLLNGELKSDNFPKKSDNFDTSFKKLIQAIQELPENLIPYSQIAQTVYQIKDTSDSEGIEGVVLILKDRIVRYIEENSSGELDSVANVLIKIYEHIVLSDAQMNSLHSDQSANVAAIDERITVVQEKYNKSVEEWKKVKPQIDSMYSSFVSVLGIFVAISFTLFSAASLVKEILTVSSDPSSQELGSKIILSGISVVLIYLLIVGLFQGITMVTRQYYFFSIRKLYIVCVTAGSIIVFGYVYGHTKISFSHLWIFVICMSAYITVALMLYAFGNRIKKFFINFGKTKNQLD